jgi:hypothetical protein
MNNDLSAAVTGARKSKTLELGRSRENGGFSAFPQKD